MKSIIVRARDRMTETIGRKMEPIREEERALVVAFVTKQASIKYILNLKGRKAVLLSYSSRVASYLRITLPRVALYLKYGHICSESHLRL